MSGLLDIAGAGVQAEASLAQGRAEYASAQYNADLAMQDAGIALTKTTADIQSSQRSAAQVQGATAATAALSGGLTGSNLDIFASNAVQQELDILNLKQQSAIQQRAYQNQASQGLAAGYNALAQSKLQAAGQILSGTARAAGAAATAGGV